VPPPKPRVKAKSSLSGRNYFITMHHQAGVNFENFTEVKFLYTLLTGTYGRSNLNQSLTWGSSVKDHLLNLLFTKSAAPPEKCRPGAFPPSTPLVGALILIAQRPSTVCHNCSCDVAHTQRWWKGFSVNLETSRFPCWSSSELRPGFLKVCLGTGFGSLELKIGSVPGT